MSSYKRLLLAVVLLIGLNFPAHAANEATVGASVAFSKSGIADSFVLTGQFNITGAKFVKNIQSIPTTAGGTALNLGGLGSVGWAVIKNFDAANYVQILDAVSGNVLARIPPSGFIMLYFDPAVTAPAAIAHTASCTIEFFAVEI